jgi:hypothetical protein
MLVDIIILGLIFVSETFMLYFGYKVIDSKFSPTIKQMLFCMHNHN